MASPIPKPGKQLGELLQEQQEPFTLETYLLERGCVAKKNSGFGFSCCHGSSLKVMKRSGSSDLNKSRKGIPHSSKILRAILNKLVSITDNRNTNHSDKNGGVFCDAEKDGSHRKVAQLERFSSASSTTVFNSCSVSDTEESSASFQIDDTYSTAKSTQALNYVDPMDPREEEAATDRKIPGRFKDGRQSGPEGQFTAKTRKQENSWTCKSDLSNNLIEIEDLVLPASLLELLVQPPVEKPGYVGVADVEELVRSNSYSRCSKSKRVLLQRKQLLFDCVRELVEDHSFRDLFGPEELERFTCEKIRTWEKQSGKGSNISQLLIFDLLASKGGWCDFKQQAKEVELDIVEAILEEMKNEIVGDMTNVI